MDSDRKIEKLLTVNVSSFIKFYAAYNYFQCLRVGSKAVISFLASSSPMAFPKIGTIISVISSMDSSGAINSPSL